MRFRQSRTKFRIGFPYARSEVSKKPPCAVVIQPAFRDNSITILANGSKCHFVEGEPGPDILTKVNKGAIGELLIYGEGEVVSPKGKIAAGRSMQLALVLGAHARYRRTGTSEQPLILFSASVRRSASEQGFIDAQITTYTQSVEGLEHDLPSKYHVACLSGAVALILPERDAEILEKNYQALDILDSLAECPPSKPYIIGVDSSSLPDIAEKIGINPYYFKKKKKRPIHMLMGLLIMVTIFYLLIFFQWQSETPKDQKEPSLLIPYAIFIAGSSGQIPYRNESTSDMAIWCFDESGNLYQKFGGRGYITHDGFDTNTQDEGKAIICDRRGLVIAGFGTVGIEQNDLLIWRYQLNGVIDQSFGKSGFVVHKNAAGGRDGNDKGLAMAIDKQNRILVSGLSHVKDHILKQQQRDDMVVWRYNPNGQLDLSFNHCGFVVFRNAAGGNDVDAGEAIALDKNGHIVVAGWSVNKHKKLDMVVWRYTPSGSLDKTFNHKGYLTHHNVAGGNGHDVARSVVIDHKNRIIIAGKSQNKEGNYDVVLLCYTTQGNLDSSFGHGGVVVHHNAGGGKGDDTALSIIIDKENRFLITGKSQSSYGNFDMVVSRFLPTGHIDKTFNSKGFTTHHNAAGGNGWDEGFALAIDKQNRIIVTGQSENDQDNFDMVVWRLTPEGDLDTSFGKGQGFVIHRDAVRPDGHDVGYSVVIWNR